MKRVTRWERAEFSKVPYTISPSDVLQVRASGTLLDFPIDGSFLVEPSGTIPLGAAYGRARVKRLSLEEAGKVIQKKLEEVLKKPEVQITLPLPGETGQSLVRWREVAPPKAPYTISPGDVLSVNAVNDMFLDQPPGKPIPPGKPVIQRDYPVEPIGTIPLGPEFGRVLVKGLTLAEAEKAIQKKLAEVLKHPEVQVTLAGWKSDWQVDNTPKPHGHERDR
jgi:protein involved in polysaccharide export with SLBB domain